MNPKPTKITKSISKNKFFVLIVLLITIVAELFIFNFRFFQTFGYEAVNLTDAMLEGNITPYDNSIFHFNDDSGTITFSDINEEIKNIYIDAKSTRTLSENAGYDDIKTYKADQAVKIKINVDDKGNSNGIDMPERTIVSTVEKTKYISLNLNGESQNLKIQLNNVRGKDIQINAVALNKPVPFHFSIIRVIVIMLIAGLIYIIRPKSPFYDYKLNVKSPKQRFIIPFIVLIQIIIMLTASHINPMYVYNTVSWQNQYNELTDAIFDGHYYLNTNPDSRLANLDNPYDPSARNNAQVNVSWDHSYFEGKYYVYFGIVPALLFNIPARLIADVDITPFACILILIPIFVIMSYLLIYALAKKFMTDKDKGVSLVLYLMLSTLFVNGIGTAFLMVWPDMYSLPIFTGLVMAISGLYCWLTAFKPNKDDYKLSKPKLFIGSLCMALIAGCRPQMLLVIFTALPIFWNTVFKDRKLFSKSSITETLLFTLPVIAFAGFMFHYNYARFGSILDFGANYNLTTNDMTARGISLGRIPQGIFSYILQPLNIDGVFPYIRSTSFSTLYMGITIKETVYGGILFLQPIIWILLLIKKAKETLKEKKLFIITILFIVFGFIIVIADTLMAGILSRYYLDFSFLFVLSAIIVVFAIYHKYSDTKYIKLLNYYISTAFVISIVIVTLLIVGVDIYAPSTNNPELFWKIASAVQFWL